MRNGNLFKLCVSEIRVERIRVNRGLPRESRSKDFVTAQALLKFAYNFLGYFCSI